MLREHSKLFAQAHHALDICVTATAFISAYFIKKYLLPYPFVGLTIAPNYYVVLLMVVIIWYVTFGMFGLYTSYRKRRLSEILEQMVKAVCISMFVLIVCMYMLKITDVSRIMMGIFFLLDILLLGLSKGIAYNMLVHYRKKGFNFRNVLIIGSRQRANDVIDAIGDSLGSGYKVLGCLDPAPARIGTKVNNGVKVIGTVDDDLERILKDEVVDELVFAMPLRRLENASKAIALAEKMGVGVRIVPDWQIHKLHYNPGIASVEFEEFLNLPTLALTTTPQKPAELIIKNVFDYMAGGIGFILLLPAFAVIALAIKLTSKGPVLFKQERSGLNGRRFQLYKFRTMVEHAEEMRESLNGSNEMSGPVFKMTNDPRVTPVGKILRTMSLDELPQIINVLKGEMSLVGPRPPIPAEVEEYDLWQRRRLSMKPGITCIWQVDGRNRTDFDEWMKLDLEYIDNWSLWLDFKLLLKTIPAVLLATGK